MSFKFRVLMTFRAAFVELSIGFFALAFGVVQLLAHKPWPSSAPMQPIIPFVAIYWVVIVFGVGTMIYAYRKANNQ